MNNDPEKIRITFDDLERAQVYTPPASSGMPPPPPPTSGGPREWGSVSGTAGLASGGAEVGGFAGFFLKAWVYLGLAGGVGAFLAWAMCEPFYHESRNFSWVALLLVPLIVTAVCVGFAVAESVAERSLQKGMLRGLLALVLGLVLGLVFSFIANIFYGFGMGFIQGTGAAIAATNPGLWIVRAFAWAIFGVTGGLVYGVAGQSGKKCLYGVLGGVLGAGIGGLLFDPISLATGGGGPSRGIGFVIFGASTGLAIGLVESALKDRWLLVSGGPLAGKQFILYKPVTNLGSQQSNEIYLFKDPTIGLIHARIELRGAQAILTAAGATFLGGQPVTQRVLRSGDMIQIGRYTFQYHEKRKA